MTGDTVRAPGNASSATGVAPLLPGRVPLLGHAPKMMTSGLGFMEAARKHGGIVRIYLGRKLTYLITEPELLRRVLVTDAQSFEGRGDLTDTAREVLGNGISCSTGAFHRRQRRLVQPAFHRSRIEGYAEIMRELAVAKAGSWHAGQTISVEPEMRELALTIAAKALCSSDMGDRAVEEFKRSIPIALKGVVFRVMFPQLAKLPTPGNRRFDAALERLHAVMQNVIDDYRASGIDHGDMVSMLLAAQDDETGESMTDEQIHAEVMTLATAATETTNMQLVWAFYELANDQSLQDRVRAEVDEVVGDRPIAFADIAELEYTRRFVHEVLRKHAMWMLTRKTTADTELGGVLLPEGTEIMFSPQAVHHDERVFADPHSFDPDRWLPERMAELPRSSYLPFGTGKYVCIGESFAWTEMMIVFASVLAKWRLLPVPGHQVKVAYRKGGLPHHLPLNVQPR